jgi:hypothetical protein
MDTAAIIALAIRYLPAGIAGAHLLLVLLTRDQAQYGSALTAFMVAIGLNASVAAAHAKIDNSP